MVLLLIFFAVIITLLLWKWLGISSFDELKTIFGLLTSRNGQHVLSNLFQVDEKSKRHGGELVASVLKAHDVEEIFVLCGGHISPILVAAEKLGIKIVDTRHEVTAVFAADAVARLRQSIGVAAVTAGPGLTNTITAVKNAQMAESPLLLIGGAAPTLLKGRGALQDIDQMVLFRPLCKYVARVERLRDIVPTLRQAIKAAKSGCPGPVFVEFPVDVLYPIDLVVKEIGFNPNAKGFIQKALNAYLRCHVSRQFGGAWIPQDISPLATNIPLPKSEQVQEIVKLVKSAKRPVLLIGSQASLPPVKPAELIKAVEALGCPVFLGGMARGLLGKDHPLQMRQVRRDALKEADLTILAGTVCDFRLSYGRTLSKKSKIVALNRNYSQLTKNERAFWDSDVSVQADVATTLVQVGSFLAAGYSKPVEWVNDLRQRDNEKEAANAKKMEQKLNNGFLNPLNFLRTLDQSLPDDAILVADGGDFVGSAAYIVRPRGPLQWLDPGAFGTLGVGGGFALGAKTVYPDRPVYIIWGDGSCGYSLMEYDTFARHKLPVIGIVGNDACWTQIAREQVPMFQSSVAVNLDRTRYDNVAKSMGSWGSTIEESNVDSTREILDEALAVCRSGKQSALVNVFIGKTDFREGSISV
uniref:2-hydroxyacyl-CoA lyase 2 n=1 Tax=Caenorhabditis japonica TaxID=281687 RepID=A0A8R1HQW9_CAEJA